MILFKSETLPVFYFKQYIFALLFSCIRHSKVRYLLLVMFYSKLVLANMFVTCCEISINLCFCYELIESDWNILCLGSYTYAQRVQYEGTWQEKWHAMCLY